MMKFLHLNQMDLNLRALLLQNWRFPLSFIFKRCILFSTNLFLLRKYFIHSSHCVFFVLFLVAASVAHGLRLPLSNQELLHVQCQKRSSTSFLQHSSFFFLIAQNIAFYYLFSSLVSSSRRYFFLHHTTFQYCRDALPLSHFHNIPSSSSPRPS